MRRSGSIKAFVFIAGFLFLRCLVLPAQQITISLENDTITVDQTVVLSLSGEAKDITSLAELPAPDGLIVQMGLRDWAMNSSDGKIKFNQTFLIKPYQAGTFSIGPAWVQSGSNRIFSNKITLVVKNSNREMPDIGMICDPDKTKAYVGEQIIISLRVLSLGKIEVDNDRPVSRPFKGFWYNEGEYPITSRDSTINIRDNKYTVSTVYKEYVFPNSIGTQKIPSYFFGCMLYQVPVATGDAWTDNVMVIPVPQNLASLEVPIEVLPLPEKNKPANFAGDVGTFSLNATLDKENIRVNEPVKLTVMISGNGNINFLQLPKLEFPDEIKSYTPVVNTKTNVTSKGIEGDKTFTITLIAKKEGEYTLPGIAFSYFDPKKKEYVTIQTPEFKLKVTPGDASKDVSENNLPQSFLDDTSGWRIMKRVLWIAVPALLLMLLFYYSSRKKRKEAESTDAQKEAVEMAELPIEFAKKKPDILTMLHTAEQLIINGRIQSGIAQLYETLLSAVLFKTELGREEASIHQLRYRLGIKKLAPETVDETIRVLEELGAQRYSSQDTDRSKLSENLGKTRKLALALLS